MFILFINDKRNDSKYTNKRAEWTHNTRHIIFLNCIQSQENVMVKCDLVGLQFICYATLEQGSTICCGVKGTISEAKKKKLKGTQTGGGMVEFGKRK